MSENIKHDQLKLFVDKGVTPVCKALFRKRFNELRTSEYTSDTWTIEKFLYINRDKLLSTKEGREKEWILFPILPAHTDVNKWDPTVICFVLKEICALNKVLRINLQMLTEYLDGIGKSKEDKYENYLAELKIIIGVCLDEIKNDQLRKTISDLTENLERKQLTRTRTTSQDSDTREILQKVGIPIDDKTLRQDHEKLDAFNDELRDLVSRLECVRAKVEERQQETKQKKKEKHIEMERETPKKEIEEIRHDVESLKMSKFTEQPHTSSSPLGNL